MALDDFKLEQKKNNSLDFKDYDKIFTPENYTNLTEIGKEIYEMGSFERMKDKIKVSDIEVVNRGNDFIIKIQANDGAKIYTIDRDKLFGGFRAFRDRKKEAQEVFGFSDEDLVLPSYVFVQEGEKIPEKIERGLKEVEEISFKQGSYSNGKYYNVVKKFPQVQEAIDLKLNSMDPRLLKYSLGKVDVSVQKSWEIKSAGGYYGDAGDVELLNICKDFKILGIGGYSNENEIKDLQEGNTEIFTPKIENMDSNSIEKMYKELQNTLNEFDSEINREIQEKKIQYLERAYKYIKEKEEQLKELKDEHEKLPELLEEYYSEVEKPFKIDLTIQELEMLDMFLKNKIVALYNTGIIGDYNERIRKIGKYKGMGSSLKITDSAPYNFADAIDKIDETVSFKQDVFAVDKIIEKLSELGYEIESVGRSGFKSRNSYQVMVPKKEIEVETIKIGDAIDGKEVGEKNIWYTGKTIVEINSSEDVEKILKIIEDVKKEEKEKEIEDFSKEFELKGNEFFSVMKIGGNEKFQSVPEGYKVLANMRIANTQDHRRNLTHAYEVAIINVEKVEELKKQGQKTIEIQVPDKMKGLVIGKKGSNIKKISNELGIFIKII